MEAERILRAHGQFLLAMSRSILATRTELRVWYNWLGPAASTGHQKASNLFHIFREVLQPSPLAGLKGPLFLRGKVESAVTLLCEE